MGIVDSQHTVAQRCPHADVTPAGQALQVARRFAQRLGLAVSLDVVPARAAPPQRRPAATSILTGADIQAMSGDLLENLRALAGAVRPDDLDIADMPQRPSLCINHRSERTASARSMRTAL